VTKAEGDCRPPKILTRSGDKRSIDQGLAAYLFCNTTRSRARRTNASSLSNLVRALPGTVEVVNGSGSMAVPLLTVDKCSMRHRTGCPSRLGGLGDHSVALEFEHAHEGVTDDAGCAGGRRRYVFCVGLRHERRRRCVVLALQPNRAWLMRPAACIRFCQIAVTDAHVDKAWACQFSRFEDVARRRPALTPPTSYKGLMADFEPGASLEVGVFGGANGGVKIDVVSVLGSGRRQQTAGRAHLRCLWVRQFCCWAGLSPRLLAWCRTMPLICLRLLLYSGFTTSGAYGSSPHCRYAHKINIAWYVVSA